MDDRLDVQTLACFALLAAGRTMGDYPRAGLIFDKKAIQVYLLKCSVSEQYFFKEKLMLPAVPETILIPMNRLSQFPELSPALICNMGPTSGS